MELENVLNELQAKVIETGAQAFHLHIWTDNINFATYEDGRVKGYTAAELADHIENMKAKQWTCTGAMV